MNKSALLGMALLLLTGCAAVIMAPPGDRPASSPREPSMVPPESGVSTQQQPAARTPSQKPSPRALAAATLTEQGRAMIAAKRPDEAIRTLERAMNLHPKNGVIYYYLAEAWLLKGNPGQAEEFNRLAGIYLRNTPQWAGKVARQRMAIQNR